MYASHRDSCILSYYAHILNTKLEIFYKESKINESVLAYRSLGASNYNFAAEAYEFASLNSPVTILAFDVKGFFDNLNHFLLKIRLKRILSVSNLSDDWYKVYRSVTRFHYVDLEELKRNAAFSARLAGGGSHPIATLAELKSNGIEFKYNPLDDAGIPQGTPISASFSNLYMIDFDVSAKLFCEKIGAMYRRYSDDILVICKPEHTTSVSEEIMRLIAAERLEISSSKTEITPFDVTSSGTPKDKAAQYLGFTFREDGAAIRPSSLSRQWRKMRRAFRRAQKIGKAAIAAGKSDKIHTKRLRRRFTSLQFRNFSSYSRRSASIFGGKEKITAQIRRFERAVERQLSYLKSLEKGEK